MGVGFKRISTRLVVFFGTVFLLALGAAGAYLYVSVERNITTQMRKELATVAEGITGEKKKLAVPSLVIGAENVSQQTGLVDGLTDSMGSAITIFLVIPEGLLPVSTTVRTPEGSRALGTYVPADSPVYRACAGGETYFGRVFVLNDWYIAGYQPILDDSGSVIGVICAGVRQSNLDVLREKILSFQIGRTGSPYIMDSWRGRSGL